MIGKINAPRKYEITRAGMFHRDARPALAYRKMSGSFPQVERPTIPPATKMIDTVAPPTGTAASWSADTDVRARMVAYRPHTTITGTATYWAKRWRPVNPK